MPPFWNHNVIIIIINVALTSTLPEELWGKFQNLQSVTCFELVYDVSYMYFTWRGLEGSKFL